MNYLLTLLISFLTISSYAQKNNCAEFKTGEFRYVDESVPFRVVRNDTLQIERNLETGVEIHSSIEWKSECEFILTYKKILNLNQDVSSIIGKQISVKIVETDKNRVKVHATSDIMDEEVEFIKTNSRI